MSGKNNPSAFSALSSRQGVLAVLAGAVGVGLSIAVSFVAFQLESNSIRRQFDSLSDVRFHAADSTFREAKVILHFMDNVFLIAPPANSPGFPEYVRSIQKFFQRDISKSLKVHGLTWAPKVPDSERGEYERVAREVFDPNYQIHLPKESKNEGNGTEPSDCYPCYLSMGNTDLEKRLGEDLSHDPEMWKAMQQARDTGDAVATSPIKMGTKDDEKMGYRVFQPLFVGGSNLKNVEERRKACRGFLCLDLDIGIFVSNALSETEPVGIEMVVTDVSGSKPTIVCRHVSRLDVANSDKIEKGKASELETRDSSEFFGRKLSLQCISTDVFWVDRTIWQPWVILFCGLALSLALAVNLLGRALRSSEIERIVSSRLAAIQNERVGR